MSIIDIRTHEPLDITAIQFGDESSEYFCLVTRIENYDSKVIRLDGDDYVYVEKANVRNLIKALERAVELGWVD